MGSAFQTLKILTLLGYAAALAVYLRYFFRGDRHSDRLTMPLIGTALSVHLLYLAVISLAQRHLPVTSLGEAMTTTVFCTTALYFVIEIRTREKNPGIFVLALALAFQILSTCFIHQLRPVSPMLEAGGFAFHAIANIFGYAGFFLGFIFSLLYMLMLRQIKHKTTGRLYRRLPPLGVLDTSSAHAITFGFILFTIGLVAGAVWSKQVWGAYVKPEPKFVLAVISWAIYGAYLVMRLIPGWSRRRSAASSIAAFCILAASFLFASMFSPSHSF